MTNMSDVVNNTPEGKKAVEKAVKQSIADQEAMSDTHSLITQAKKDLLAEVRERMPEGRELYHNPPSQNGDWYDSGFNAYRTQALAAIKEIEEGL